MWWLRQKARHRGYGAEVEVSSEGDFESTLKIESRRPDDQDKAAQLAPPSAGGHAG